MEAAEKLKVSSPRANGRRISGGRSRCGTLDPSTHQSINQLNQERPMEKTQKAVLDQLTRDQRYLDRHGRAVGTVNQSQARVALDELVRSLAVHVAEQRAAVARSSRQVARRRIARKKLRCDHLGPIVAVARGMAPRGSALTTLRMPSGKCGDKQLLRAAARAALFAGVNEQLFLDQCFPADFVQRLKAAMEVVRDALIEKELSRPASAGTTKTISALISRGRKLARVLDALVLMQIGRNARLTAEWRAANATKCARRRPRAARRAHRATNDNQEA
jgi:hypothetical protein